MGIVHGQERPHLVQAGAWILCAGMSRGHRQQMLDREPCQFGSGMLRHQFGKERLHLVADLQESFLHGETYGRTGEGLGGRIHGVRVLRAVGRPPMLSHDLVVPEYHEAVHLISTLVESLEEICNRLGRNAFSLRRAARKPVGIRREILRRNIEAAECCKATDGFGQSVHVIMWLFSYCPIASSRSSMLPTTPSNSLYISSGSCISGI